VKPLISKGYPPATAGRFKQLLFVMFIGLLGIIVNLTLVVLTSKEKFGLYWLIQSRGVVSGLMLSLLPLISLL
jgi:hypothetical protein